MAALASARFLKYSGRCSESDAMKIIFASIASIFTLRSYVIFIF